MLRVDLVNALYDGPRFFRRDQAHLDMDADDQPTVLSLNLASNPSYQAPVAGIDVARFQLAPKLPETQTTSLRGFSPPV
jgi:hypothetical protein